MGNDQTTSPPGRAQDNQERWRSDSETIERRDRELGNRVTDPEPSDADDRSIADDRAHRRADWRESSDNAAETPEGKR